MARSEPCVICGQPAKPDEFYEVVCADCGERYPQTLINASIEPGDYATELANGQILRFTDATIEGDYVHISRIGKHNNSHTTHMHFPFPGGVAVRVDAMIWIADDYSDTPSNPSS